jgi:hypothetical protein
MTLDLILTTHNHLHPNHLEGTMRNLKAITIAVALALGFSTPLAAQEAEEGPEPGTVVFSQWICPPQNVGTMNAAADTIFGPILDELQSEGKLMGWGVLTHSWGDEWNWNVYYVVESHAAFLEFWSDYISRVVERHPGALQQITPLCTEHRDNIYSVHVAH